MKLQETERQIMANLEYERACSCLKQAEGNASMDFCRCQQIVLCGIPCRICTPYIIKDGLT